jgi:O-antigen ligase
MLVALLLVYGLRFRRFFIGLVVMLAVVGLLYVIVIEFAPRAVYERLIVTTQTDPTGSGRTRVYQVGIEAGMDSPIVGQGTGGFKTYTGGAMTYPHNLFIELFAEHGLGGLLAGGLLLLLLIKYSIRCVHLRPLVRAESDFVLALVIFGLGNSMFSSDLPPQLALWLGCGMLIGLDRMGKEEFEAADLQWSEEELAADGELAQVPQ